MRDSTLDLLHIDVLISEFGTTILKHPLDESNDNRVILKVSQNLCFGREIYSTFDIL